MIAVEPPPHAALGGPAVEAGQVVVVQAEAAPHRLAGGEVEHLGGGEPRRGEVEQLGDHPEEGVRLAQRPVGEPHPDVGRALGALHVGPLLGEGRLHERREGLHVRAHHQDVARLQGRIVRQGVQDRVAHHLHLASAAVAGVDLQAPVGGVERHPLVGPAAERRPRRRPVGPHAGLEPGEQGAGLLVERPVVVEARPPAQHELHLARVPAPGAEQGVERHPGAAVVGAEPRPRALREGADALPQRGRGVEQEEVDLAVVGDGPEHVEVARRKARQAEERDALGELEDAGLLTQPPARVGQALRRARGAHPRAQPPPELGLPARAVRKGRIVAVGVVAGGPGAEHARPVDAVAVEQVGDVAHAREAPPGALGLLGGGAGPPPVQVGRQAREPRIAEVGVHHVEQRPHQALDQPRVTLAPDPGGGRQGVAHQPPGEREFDVRADPAGRGIAGTQARRERLGEPALDPARGDRDDLRGKRIPGRGLEQLRQPGDQTVRALRTVSVDHAGKGAGFWRWSLYTETVPATE